MQYNKLEHVEFGPKTTYIFHIDAICSAHTSGLTLFEFDPTLADFVSSLRALMHCLAVQRRINACTLTAIARHATHVTQSRCVQFLCKWRTKSVPDYGFWNPTLDWITDSVPSSFLRFPILSVVRQHPYATFHFRLRPFLGAHPSTS